MYAVYDLCGESDYDDSRTFFSFFQAEDGIRHHCVTGVQTCALPILHVAEISKLARDGKLKAGDMQGGTFSISSLGGLGGTAFTPIINAPEVAILGVSRSSLKPIFSGKGEKGEDIFKARLMLPLSLSYDHRVIDGATAARFSSTLVSVLSDIRKLVL